MRANTLVDLLLELNVVNAKELDREINRLAARLYDPRAATWFKRVARYWITNLDKLQAPQTAKAVPREMDRVGGRPSDYYAEPSSRADLLYPAWRGEQPPTKPNVCQQCKGEGFVIDKKTGEPVKCKACKGTGLGEKIFAGSDRRCPDCRGKGSVRPGDEPATWPPAEYSDSGAITCKKCGGTGLFEPCDTCGGAGKVPNAAGRNTACKACKGTGRAHYKQPAGREGVFMSEGLVRWLLEVEADLPGYAPKEQTYTTTMHAQPEVIECPYCAQPLHGPGEQTRNKPDPKCSYCHGTGKIPQRLAADIERNFTHFQPKKAKTKRLHGEPPTKKEVQPWMLDPQSTDKELYHFNPIQVRQRDLFQRLTDLVNFLNYSYTLSQKPLQLTPDELEDLTPEEAEFMAKNREKGVKDAVALFKQLQVMKLDDAQSFRDILLKSEEFMDNVKNKPELFGAKSGKVLARQGNLVLRRTDTEEAALLCGMKRSYWNPETPGEDHQWCLNVDANVRSYIGEGPIFFVEKNGMAYIAIHFGPGDSAWTKQVKNPDNTALGRLPEEHSEAIAPLLVNFSTELPTKDFAHEAPQLAGLLGKLRRRAGLE